MSESEHASLYEISVMANGEIALKKVGDEEAEALVKVRFSEQAKFFLGSDYTNVARVMIEAGLDAVSELQKYSPELDKAEKDFSSEDEPDPILH